MDWGKERDPAVKAKARANTVARDLLNEGEWLGLSTGNMQKGWQYPVVRMIPGKGNRTVATITVTADFQATRQNK